MLQTVFFGEDGSDFEVQVKLDSDLTLKQTNLSSNCCSHGFEGCVVDSFLNLLYLYGSPLNC